MRGRQRSSVTLAESDRGRVPFALIGVVLLVASSTAVVSLQTRGEPSADVDAARAFDRIETTTHSILRDAATTGLRDAAAAPVTDASGTVLGDAIDGGNSDETFRNYVRLRIYLAARAKLSRTEQNLGDGVIATASLPPIEGDADCIETGLDRVKMTAGYYDGNLETGVVSVTIEDVSLTVEDGKTRETVQRTFDLTVPTTVFEMHEKSQEYERRLNAGFFEQFDAEHDLGYGYGAKFAVRQYPVSWAKTYFDRFGPKRWDRAFEPIHDSRSTEILANLAAFDVQESTFGTTDPAADRIRRERKTCFALATGYKVYDAVSKQKANTSTLANTWGLNRSRLENATNRSSPGQGMQINEDTLCRATRYMMGGSEGELGDPPSIRDITERFIKKQTGKVSTGVEIPVDLFADAAYYEIRYGETVDRLRNLDDVGVEWPPESDEDAEADAAWDEANENIEQSDSIERQNMGDMSLDPDTTFAEVIDHVYDVEVDPTESVARDRLRPRAPKPSGDGWNELTDERRYEVVDPGAVDVTIEAGPSRNIEGDTWTDLRDVTVTIENELRHVRKWRRVEGRGQNATVSRTTTTATREVTFESDVDIDARHSRHTQVDDNGIEHAYERGGDVGPEGVPNFERVPRRALERVFGVDLSTQTDLEAQLDDEIDTETIVSRDDMRAITHESATFEPVILDEDENETLQSWLQDEADAIRETVKDEVPPTEAGPTAFVNDDPILVGMRENITDRKPELIYGDDPDERYADPKAKVRIEAVKIYLDNVIEWTNEFDDAATDTKNQAKDGVMGPLDSVDGEIAEVVRFAQKAIAGDVELSGDADFEGSPLYDDVAFTIDASPTYLEATTVTRTDVPAVRASGAGFTDLDDDIEHGPLVAKHDNLVLPRPGLPLVPWPGYWYATLSTWNLQVDGEYARFELRADVSDPATSEPIRYIQDNREVELELADGRMTVGSVTPIDFESDTVVAVVVPSHMKVPRGKFGIGETPGNYTGCAGPYPETGPEPSKGDCGWIKD
ncbi:Surface protein, possibly associated with type IV pili like system [Halapricum desulfuricans]|uniref:Surface protein, possibly associated with type IV pili like system n=1 Tax=Halapricum desulfuricans TaxID=2841257 RepID=A0A897NGB4_9EURY|nr:hypothetical protein [Halapricum desulfuricans]QSG11752.1 Surface protein, possibly associated with type IV pili like system [Halapricum desulfuricans]